MLILGADMSVSTHKTSKANNIYVMGELFTQEINDTTLYAEKKFYRNFKDPGRNIYDFVVDYKSINGVKPIYGMHRYLMTKHNISP